MSRTVKSVGYWSGVGNSPDVVCSFLVADAEMRERLRASFPNWRRGRKEGKPQDGFKKGEERGRPPLLGTSEGPLRALDNRPPRLEFGQGLTETPLEAIWEISWG